jgi:rod shape-determining protein MreD
MQFVASGSKTRYFFSEYLIFPTMERYLRSAVVVLVLLIVQTTFIPYIAVSSYLPDILLLWIVYVALTRGQVEATMQGFFIGALQDVTATKFLGLAALAKTVSGFAAGYFFNDNTTEQMLGSYRYITFVAICSFVHGIVYFAVFFQGTEGSLLLRVLQFSLAYTFYTSILALIPMFAFSQKFSTSWVR